MKELIIQESGVKAFEFISKHINISEKTNLFISTSTLFNIENQPDDYFKAIINLKRINDIRRINKYFEAVNTKLPVGGLFVNYAETNALRKKRILKKFPIGFNYIYYSIDFIFKRAFPKLPVLKKIYFFITNGRNRVISKAETFGRLYSCGFEVIAEDFINNHLYFVAKKIKSPAYDYNPTYGPLVTLSRIGKNGKLIKVYKMRTMYAYSEYLQDYIYCKNHLGNGGKFHNDFRVNTIGRFMRKFWIDELPMFINVLKGDLKLYGVRPISEQYFSLYDDDLKQFRTKYKPGLIPPYYSKLPLPETLDEIMESERVYLNKYQKNPFLTDWSYFWKTFYNIVFKNTRSK